MADGRGALEARIDAACRARAAALAIDANVEARVTRASRAVVGDLALDALMVRTTLPRAAFVIGLAFAETVGLVARTATGGAAVEEIAAKTARARYAGCGGKIKAHIASAGSAEVVDGVLRGAVGGVATRLRVGQWRAVAATAVGDARLEVHVAILF